MPVDAVDVDAPVPDEQTSAGLAEIALYFQICWFILTGLDSNMCIFRNFLENFELRSNSISDSFSFPIILFLIINH